MKHPTFTTGLLTLALLGLGACQADRTAAPRIAERGRAADTVAQTPIASADVSGPDAALDDAAGRLAPTLEDPGAAAELPAQLRQLSQALGTGDQARARSALGAARATLARAGLSPDAAAIGLALDRAEWLLGGGERSDERPLGRSLPPDATR